MPDLGSAYYPMDEASGLVAYDTGGLHNGQYYYQTFNEYQGTTPTTPAQLEYRIAAPTVTGYAMGFNVLSNGRPTWSNPYNWVGMKVPTTAFGWGAMYQRQPFTIAMATRWNGFGSSFVSSANFFAGAGSYGWATGISTPMNEYGYSFGEPHLITFSRFAGGGNTRTVTASIDIPALVDYNIWDDWGGGLYREPLKVGAWFQLVLRYDGDYKSIWINGIKVAEDSTPDTIQNVSGNPDINFGASMNVDMAEVGIWHRALTDEEITGG